MFIFADRGNTGENAATALCRRALQAGVEALMYLPKSDDDFK
jgi:hypothetical protein